MDIEQLKYFLAVCDHSHMTRAADALFISQSSLSKHIGQLEKELGVPLFDRTSRNIRITSAGMDFAQYAREEVDRYEAILCKLQGHKEPGQTQIAIGTIPILAQYGLHKRLLDFQKKNPQIRLSLLEEKSDHILKLLDDELVELAIVRTASLTADNYKIIPLAEDELVMACSNQHPLAAMDNVCLTELAEEKMLLLDVGTTGNVAVQACQKAGFAPQGEQVFTRIETILGYVAENAGVALLMRRDLNAFDCSGISLKEITPQTPSTVALAFPHGHKLSEAARAFRDYLTSLGTNAFP